MEKNLATKDVGGADLLSDSTDNILVDMVEDVKVWVKMMKGLRFVVFDFPSVEDDIIC